MQLLNRRSNGIDIGSELVEALNDLRTDYRSLEHMLVTLTERVDALQRMVDSIGNGSAAGAYLASRVDAALVDPAQKSRTVIVALAAEMTAGISDRSLVSRMVAARAEYDPDHTVWGESDSEVPFAMARYLAEPVEGSNVWGSAVTRRGHNMLTRAGVKPARTVSA